MRAEHFSFRRVAETLRRCVKDAKFQTPPLVLAIMTAVLAVAGQDKPSSSSPPPASQEAAAAAPASPYAGAETCAMCHEDVTKSFARNRHHLVNSVSLGKTKVNFQGKACEACHGPGAKHAESMDPKDIRQPAKLAAVEATKVCSTCHFNNRTIAGREQAGHGRNQVPCVTCHKIHAEPPRDVAPNKRVTQLCQNCHSGQLAEFNRPHHHPVPEAAMSCVDCHNPHGGPRVRQIQAVNANEPGCLKCHGDKRGPFAFEHAPVKTEGCAACHEPHGSANPMMLKRHEQRFVCLECHANVGAQQAAKTGTSGGIPPAFHDLRSPRFNNCTTCHVKIHGSQSSRALLR